jgi:hypothetical protein
VCLLLVAVGIFDIELLKLVPSFLVLWYFCPHFNILGGSCGDEIEIILYFIFQLTVTGIGFWIIYAIYMGACEWWNERKVK